MIPILCMLMDPSGFMLDSEHFQMFDINILFDHLTFFRNKF